LEEMFTNATGCRQWPESFCELGREQKTRKSPLSLIFLPLVGRVALFSLQSWPGQNSSILVLNRDLSISGRFPLPPPLTKQLGKVLFCLSRQFMT
jgi:hypothetical protein